MGAVGEPWIEEGGVQAAQKLEQEEQEEDAGGGKGGVLVMRAGVRATT